jgi:alanine-synthesizing transaminase
MRKFQKSNKLDGVRYEVRGPIVSLADQMIAQGDTILKLNIGNPAAFELYAPDEIIKDMLFNVQKCQGYSDSKGLFSARKAIMQYYQLRGLPNVCLDDIYVGNGVSELIMMSMQALLNNGDEVLLPAPDYPLWTAAVTLSGGKAVHYICDEQANWYPDIEDMRSKVTANTKAIVVINPNNPTGTVYPKEVLLDIIQVARENELMIFCDEIYSQLIMDDVEHVSLASLAPDVFVVTMNGLSKSHRVAGFRAGWMVFSGCKQIARDYLDGVNMLASMRLCANVPAQSIIQTALGGYQSLSELMMPGGRIYEQRNFIYERLNSIDGISVGKPQGAFYIFPRLDVKKFNITSDSQFALDFLRHQKVLIVQGSGFNWVASDHFRIVYLPRIEDLAKAMDRLEIFLSGYQQKVMFSASQHE